MGKLGPTKGAEDSLGRGLSCLFFGRLLGMHELDG